jgi:6-phosphofructokinase 1
MYVDESFGFQTAYSVAVEVLKAAHVEAKGAPNGVGLVKVMGRHSGFIACHAALAMSDVNFVLIPEVSFKLEGESGFLNALRLRLLRRRHAVVAVAEGAGQEYLQQNQQRDPSGNLVLQDIGVFLKERINSYFKNISMEINLRYIDPSYAIRSMPPLPQDSIYCMRLAQNAVHAGMCGKTELIVSRLAGQFVHVPMRLTTSQRKQVDPNGELYLAVLESTWDPRRLV